MEEQALPKADVKAPQGLRNPLTLGMLLALAAAFTYGTTQVLTRQLVTGIAPAQVGASLTLLSGTFVLFAISARDVRKDLRAPRRSIVLMGLSGIAASTGVLTSFFALSLAPVTLVSPIFALNPLFAMLLTHLFLQRLERITPRMVIGALLVVGGVVLVVLGRGG